MVHHLSFWLAKLLLMLIELVNHGYLSRTVIVNDSLGGL